MGLLNKILFKYKTENINKTANAAAYSRDVLAAGKNLKKAANKIFGRSLFVRLVDSGSCNACENELAALSNPYYDIERFGIKFVASPKHADILIVTGCVTRNMLAPLLNTYENVPAPKLVVTAGDCAAGSGLFAGSYSVCGPVSAHLKVSLHIEGCPPEPKVLIERLLCLMDDLKNDGRVING